MFFSGRLFGGTGAERFACKSYGSWQNSFTVEVPGQQAFAAPFDLQPQANPANNFQLHSCVTDRLRAFPEAN